ncbi:MAG: DUF2341 domain-containing protein [Candidatus Lokiarchaeota archaeon]|nr:DUF2341 domain-containing protein [Candidatus Lokiarchaeota archaeon]
MKYKNMKLNSTILIGLILISSLLSISMPTNFNNKENEIKDEDQFIEDILNTNAIGEDPWWNSSFQWRKCLSITNPGTYNLIDNWVYLTIDLSDSDYVGRIQSNGMDLRIVENGVVRDYWVEVNHPSSGMLTIWFEANSTAGETDYDTYMYFGNNTITSRGSTHVSENPGGLMWLKFDESSGTTASDYMGNYDATLVGSPVFVTDAAQGSHSLDFDGTGDYGYISKSYNAANAVPEMTACVWFKTSFTAPPSSTTYDSSNWAFLDFDRSEYWNFYIRGDNGKISYSTTSTSGGTDDFDSNTDSLNDGAWHFACVVYDGSDKIIYIGGNEDARLPASSAHNGYGLGTGTLRYGIIGDGSEADAYPPTATSERNDIYYDGQMDDLRYWERALSPGEIDWLANYYDMSITPLSLTEKSATVTVVVKDIDGRRVPGAEVQLWNGSEVVNVSGFTSLTTDSNGEVEFSGVSFGSYNMTVNYTISYDSTVWEEIVYDSRTITGGEFSFVGLIVTETIHANLWTIDFDINDLDGDPLYLGYIVVNSSDVVMANLTLNSAGTAQFRWLYNSEGYNYSIYYFNRDIAIQPSTGTLIKWGTATYGTISEIYDVISNAVSPYPETYVVDKTNFVPGSSLGVSGAQKAVEIHLNCENMNDNITRISTAYYQPSVNPKDIIDEFPEATSASIEYLPLDDGVSVYGFQFIVSGENLTTCTGTITLNITYTHMEQVTVNLTKLTITVIDNVYWDAIPGMDIRVEINGTTDVVVDKGLSYGLETDSDGVARGKINANTVFWYKQGIYNISVWPIPSLMYQVLVNDTSDPSQIPPGDPQLNGYEFNLTSASWIILEAKIDSANDQTLFEDYTVYRESNPDVEISNVTWGENFTVFANLTYTNDGGNSWNPDDNVNTIIYCTVKSTLAGNPVLFVRIMSFDGDGGYSIEFNSSILSAGTSSKSYIFELTGKKVNYRRPDPVSFSLTILTLSTGLTLHEYDPSDSTPDELPKKPTNQKYYTSVYYGRTLNITMRYFDSSSSSTLTPDTYTYYWEDDSGIMSGSLVQDHAHSGYWVLSFDSSLSSISKEYSVRVTIGLQNHTRKTNYEFFITVNQKHTTLNGSATPIYTLREDVWVRDDKIIYFEYNDSDDDQRLGSLNTNTVYWYKQGENGTDTVFPSTVLVETTDKLHALDLSTGDLSVGVYIIQITISKNQYEYKSIALTLYINKRPIHTGYEDIFKTIDQGASFRITLNLTDTSNNSVPITNAMIYITGSFGNLSFTETQTPGIYYLDFPTSRYDTFFQPITIRGTIYMEKELHETTEISVVLTIEMPKVGGIPTFYLIMIIGAVVAVAGSLGAYRWVQLSRIPKFVKKNKVLRKTINNKGTISESDMYPPKEQAIAKLLGNRWDKIGISLEDVLGVGRQKGKKLLNKAEDSTTDKDGGES